MDCDIQTYKGHYGASNFGTLVHTKISVPDSKPTFENKEIILVVDLSGSMESSIKQLRASLRAFWSSINELENSDTCDIFIPSKISLRLIGYSDNAWEIYPGGSAESDSAGESKSFDQSVIDDVYSRGYTNMGAGIVLAFAKTDPRKATWIVVLSDGRSNQGAYQSPDAFTKLMTVKPSRTRVLSIGYGDNFNADTLRAIGDFTYISDPEDIPVFFGNLATEVHTAVAITASIKASFGGKIVIGSKKIGCLCSGRDYLYGIVPKKAPIDGKIILTYDLINFTDLEINTLIAIDVFNVPAPSAGGAPEDVRRIYYSFAAMRRLNILYSCMKSPNIIAKVKADVESWKEECAQESKAKVLGFVAKLEAGVSSRTVGYQMVADVNDTQRQYRTLDLTSSAKNTCTAYQLFL